MSGAITQAAQQLLAHVEDKGEGRRSTCLPFDVEALRAALSKPAPSPQPAVPVVEAFAEGWRMATDWANRDDLLPDMDSPQYAKERDERLAELRPAVEPMTPEQRDAAIDAKLAEYGYPANTRNAARAGWYACLQALGITAKAEDAHQPTKDAEKP